MNGSPSDSDDRTTEYAYNGANQVLTMTARLPSSAFQTTAYIYDARTANGDGVNANNVLVAIQYPNKSTGAASSGEQETYTVNALGEVSESLDRNGTTHTITRDVLGRTVSDAATVAGGNPNDVDTSVLRIETTYNTQGLPELLTSFDATSGGSVVNQIERLYNGLGQLTNEYQEHAGAVDGSTPQVQYAYSDLTLGSRLETLTYPDGRELTYNYDGGLDGTISRLSSISDLSATLESYTYLGLRTVVERAHPEPGITLTYVGTGPGEAGDDYVGLDRFYRVLDQRWTDGVDDLDRYTYTYDRNSNRTSRGTAATGAPSGLDEAYFYDGLNRLTKMNRGTLSSNTITDGNATYARQWDTTTSGSAGLDALGNWKGVTTDTNGGTAGGATTETRGANKQNQISSISAGSTPTYDPNGNMISDEAGQQYTYDAWNRTIAVKNNLGVTKVAYGIDAMSRRTGEAIGGAGVGTDTDLYYSANWQLLEERAQGATDVISQNVWSPVYVDALIERDRDTDTDGATDTRNYAMQDANFNVTGLSDDAGNVIERYQYDPYGVLTVLDDDFSADGDSTSDVGNRAGFQGTLKDLNSGNNHIRNRDLRGALGVWGAADPAGYPNGPNRNEFEGTAPTEHVDPLGLDYWVDPKGHRRYDHVGPNTWIADPKYGPLRPEEATRLRKERLRMVQSASETGSCCTIKLYGEYAFDLPAVGYHLGLEVYTRAGSFRIELQATDAPGGDPREGLNDTWATVKSYYRSGQGGFAGFSQGSAFPSLLSIPMVSRAWGTFTWPDSHMDPKRIVDGSLVHSADGDDCALAERIIQTSRFVGRRAEEVGTKYQIFDQNSNSYIGEIIRRSGGIVEKPEVTRNAIAYDRDFTR